MKHRDVSLISISGSEVLVTACDSCGGIGEKEGDVVKAPPYIVGKLTTRVCLMEVLAVNAKPIGMSVNICSEPQPTGSEILKGIMDELNEISIDIPITISTEKNMKTSMTALGITLFGKVSKSDILLNKVHAGDNVYIIGEPLIGEEVLKNPDKICTSNAILELMKRPSVNEIIPVGSQGIKGELEKFSDNTGHKIHYEDSINIDINKSGGPNTVSIVIASGSLTEVAGLISRKIGELL